MPEAELEMASTPPERPSSISVDGGAPPVLAMAGWYWENKQTKNSTQNKKKEKMKSVFALKDYNIKLSIIRCWKIPLQEVEVLCIDSTQN